MNKEKFAVLAGIVTGFVVVSIGDFLTQIAYPPPANLNFQDKEALKAFVATLPVGNLMMMLTFWLASSFFGGWMAGSMNPPLWKRNALITGVVLLAAAIGNMIMIPHPVWMLVTSVALYLPLALLGGRLSTKGVA